MNMSLGLRLFFALSFGFLFNCCTQSKEVTPSQPSGLFHAELPSSVSFSGENVPLQINHIKERFDREVLVNTFWHSNSILLFKRAEKYFPIIEPILRKNGIPDDFKYLAVIESGLINVTSPVGAEGFWQFMAPTAREYGLEVNANVDERLHIIKSTQSASDYLNDAYRIFGNWTLAAAAYNAGIQRIKSSLEKQKVTSYYDLFLNEETSRYIYRIVATKTIFETPRRYGFSVEKTQSYKQPLTRLVHVNTPILDLVEFAKAHAMTYGDLRVLNPWLKGYSLANRTRKDYEVAVFVK